MKEFAALLDRFWITREENRELYYALKRAQPEYRNCEKLICIHSLEIVSAIPTNGQKISKSVRDSLL